MEQNGYYSLSVNPTYISTWYNSLSPRRKKFAPEPFERSQVNDFEIDPAFASDPLSLVSWNSSKSSNNQPAQFADNSHHGKISSVALRKITKAIDYALYLATPKKLPNTLHGKDFTFRLNFVTLDLSSEQIHSDNEIKKQIFQPMLNCLRQKYKVINYIWRAEKQANGNIHFHVITDKFIPWLSLRNDWNKYQQNLGYITRYRQNQVEFHKSGFRYRPELFKHWSPEDQKKAYKKGMATGWESPNSTDVHSLKNVSNIKQYFVKYFTKSTQSDHARSVEKKQFSVLEGRLWGCSERLTNIKGARADIDSQLGEELSQIIKNDKIRTHKSDFFTISFVHIDYLKKKGFTAIPYLFESFIKATFPEYRPPNLFN